MNIDVRRLRVFLAVADALHFGRAAEQLRIAQPSVSQQVARLERQLGCLLFDRGNRQVALTEAGRELAWAIKPVINNLDAVLEQFVNGRHAARRLQVGVVSSLASFLVPLSVSGAQWSGVEVHLREGSLSTLLQRLRSLEADVVFCYTTVETQGFEGLTAQQLDQRRARIAIPTSDPLSEVDRPVDWAVAASRPWIMTSSSRQYRDDMVQRFARRGFQVQVVAEASTLSGQLAMVAAGIGWTFTSPWAPIPPGVNVKYLDDLDPVYDTLGLMAVMRPTNEPNQDVIALIAAVSAQAAEFKEPL